MKALLFLLGLVLFLVGIGVACVYRSDLPYDALALEYGRPPSHFVSIAGMRVHYRDEGRGRPIVLIHGLASSLYDWDGWAARLSREHRVLRLDLPGSGLTGPSPARDYRMSTQAEVVIAWLDRLGLSQVDVAGASLGGRVALELALRNPSRVRRLVLVDSVGLSGTKSVAPADVVALPDVLARFFFRWTPRFLVRRTLEQNYGDPRRLTDAVVERHYALGRRAGNRDALIDMFRAVPDPNVDDRLAELDLPVLVQWGARDRVLPVEFAARFEHGIRGAKRIEYTGAGHLLAEELPDATARDAATFLAGE